MRKEYDFSKSIKNPYVGKLKKQIKLRLEAETIEYFKHLARETDIPHENLIALFLNECAQNKKKPSIKWRRASLHP